MSTTTKSLRNCRGPCRSYLQQFEWRVCNPFVKQISSTAASFQDVEISRPASTSPLPSHLDPNLVSTPRHERALIKTGVYPIGSRRRRAALRGSRNIPFELLPYQCFQEARQVLQEDRKEKLKLIEIERTKIERLEIQDPKVSGGELQKQQRLNSMNKYLDRLKILADINDPLVKKRFEDGEGDLNRPIYRYLTEKKWRSYRRLILMQRITQMNVVPDILPAIDPTADVTLAFGRHTVQPGEFVDSRVSTSAPRINIQVFDKGERMITIVAVDPDVPDPDNDGFTYRCHFIAANITISPTRSLVQPSELDERTQVILPWLPPTSQKGAPYRRLSVFVLQHKEGQSIDADAMKPGIKRDGFTLRSFVDRHKMQPVGCFLFRTQWDEGMESVMKNFGVEGWDIEFKHKRVDPLPPKKKDGARYR